MPDEKTEHMKFQGCKYKKKSGDPWKEGIARMNSFGMSDVLFIVDAETGKHVGTTCYDYRLYDGMLCHIIVGGGVIEL